MTDFVVDASIAVKWVVAESDSQAALGLFRHRLFAPDLLVAECANALWKKVRRNELSAEEATLCARLLQSADIELSPMRPLWESATRFAVLLDHPAYDCVYLALAESLSCDFVTADTRFAAKPLPAGTRARVVTLAAAVL
ncbi:MAG TPA: type II toxin-antitoxin system VapC family toxin [Stellaceae bacterium]|jgi:predicted nucleic acid-binding protein|nr:type II toxin-antitoxin system VapC family toxin [Stellaceae bacterium]